MIQKTTDANPNKNLLFQKVGIFIDAENIEMSGLKHHEKRTDYKKLLDHVGDREITRILYYKPEYKEISEDFETFWASQGGEIKRPAKNADTFLVIDAVTMSDKLDVVIILGGDKDFLPLIWYLRSRGCKVEIWSWPETTSPEVKEAADLYFPITKDYVIHTHQKKRRTSTTDSKKTTSRKATSSSTKKFNSKKSTKNQTTTTRGKPTLSGRKDAKPNMENKK